MADSTWTSPTGHARHDPVRVAEAVDRGGRLAPVLRFCQQCGQLYADLVALTGALSLAALPARPRDYTLRASDAHRLRAGGWRAWWSTLGTVRDHVTRPLAIGFTTLGLAGLLVTAAPSLVPSLGSAAAPSHQHDRIEAAAGPDSGTPITTGLDPTATPVMSLTSTLSFGLLAVGGGLFAVRRVAAHSRRVR